jgi:serine/threonine protein kinase
MEKAGEQNLKNFFKKMRMKLSVIFFSKIFNKQISLIESIFQKILSAVDFLHSHNIVHGDLKLSNIMISSSFEIKLIDFGFSTIVKKPDQLNYKFRGSPLYMAPEIFLESPYDGITY